MTASSPIPRENIDWELRTDDDQKAPVATIKGAGVWPIPQLIPDVAGCRQWLITGYGGLWVQIDVHPPAGYITLFGHCLDPSS